MAGNITSDFDSFWHRVTYNSADHRVRDRFLMGSPLGIITLTICQYILLEMAKKFMNKRKEAFEITKLAFAFRVYVLVINFYFSIEGSRLGWLAGYNWLCEPIDRSNSQHALKIVQACHHFVLFKTTYVLELLIWILKKDEKFLTFYAFFHHLTMPLILWIGTNYQPGGHITFAGYVLSLTHIVIMGSVISRTIKPSLKKGDWFKTMILCSQVSY